MARIVVQKYGGSSVADPAKIRRVAERIAATRAEGKQVCVVVSAMGSTTDELLARARQISDAPPRRELDMLLTCGERASMALLSMAVSEQGYEAISFTGSQSGILTNDRHSGAKIIEVRPFRVQDELERGKVVIVAGFQGVSYKREITTLGRGGSDTTAVALAAALQAEYCEICSDVDGVYTADPRLVDAARLMEAISHDEMLELAAHGARVLHAEAVEFARRCGVALYARATQGGGAGTRIDDPDAIERIGVAGVTSMSDLVRLRGPAALLEAAARDRLPMVHMRGSTTDVELWICLDDVPDWPAVRARLADTFDELAVDEHMGAVSVVGHGLGADPAKLDRVRQRCLDSGVEVESIVASPLRITVFCAGAAVDTLTRGLHAAMVER